MIIHQHYPPDIRETNRETAAALELNIETLRKTTPSAVLAVIDILDSLESRELLGRKQSSNNLIRNEP